MNYNTLYILILDVSTSAKNYINYIETLIYLITNIINDNDYLIIYNYSGCCSKLCSPIKKSTFNIERCISNLKGAIKKKGSKSLYSAFSYIINDHLKYNLNVSKTISFLLASGYDDNKNNINLYQNYNNFEQNLYTIAYNSFKNNIYNFKNFKYITSNDDLINHIYNIFNEQNNNNNNNQLDFRNNNNQLDFRNNNNQIELRNNNNNQLDFRNNNNQIKLKNNNNNNNNQLDFRNNNQYRRREDQNGNVYNQYNIMINNYNCN